MMDFKAALAAVEKWEGLFSNDAADPGGATKYGITRKTLARYRGHPVTVQDVMDLTPEEAEDIYRLFYWQHCACDLLPDVLRLAVFDCAVNQGVGRAGVILQHIAGVTKDGAIGPKTVEAVAALDPGDALRDFMARRSLHYSSLPTLLRYGFGWFRRLFDIHRRCVASGMNTTT